MLPSRSLLLPAAALTGHHKLGSLVESRRFQTAQSFQRRWPWLGGTKYQPFPSLRWYRVGAAAKWRGVAGCLSLRVPMDRIETGRTQRCYEGDHGTAMKYSPWQKRNRMLRGVIHSWVSILLLGSGTWSPASVSRASVQRQHGAQWGRWWGSLSRENSKVPISNKAALISSILSFGGGKSRV